MKRLYCRRCQARPLRLVVLRSGIPVCGECGHPLELQRSIELWPVVGGLLLGAVLALSLLPQASRLPMARIPSWPAAPQGREGGAPVQPSPSGGPAPVRAPATLPPDWLLGELAAADLQWIPRSEVLADGAVRYVVKRRVGEPELNLEQLRALIADPPTYAREQGLILSLLKALQRAGVHVSLMEPRKVGAAGEWDPAGRALRIQPRVVAKGSLDFAQVLNHEAIHVAQSCRGGGVARAPRPLGLATAMEPELERHLREPVYAKATDLELRLEREAYANQHDLELGLTLLQVHCRLPRS
jgi:hypothetical protein